MLPVAVVAADVAGSALGTPFQMEDMDETDGREDRGRGGERGSEDAAAVCIIPDSVYRERKARGELLCLHCQTERKPSDFTDTYYTMSIKRVVHHVHRPSNRNKVQLCLSSHAVHAVHGKAKMKDRFSSFVANAKMTQPLEYSFQVDMVVEPARLRPELPHAEPQGRRAKKLLVIHRTSGPEMATVGRDDIPDLGRSLRRAC